MPPLKIFAFKNAFKGIPDQKTGKRQKGVFMLQPLKTGRAFLQRCEEEKK